MRLNFNSININDLKPPVLEDLSYQSLITEEFLAESYDNFSTSLFLSKQISTMSMYSILAAHLLFPNSFLKLQTLRQGAENLVNQADNQANNGHLRLAWMTLIYKLTFPGRTKLNFTPTAAVYLNNELQRMEAVWTPDSVYYWQLRLILNLAFPHVTILPVEHNHLIASIEAVCEELEAKKEYLKNDGYRLFAIIQQCGKYSPYVLNEYRSKLQRLVYSRFLTLNETEAEETAWIMLLSLALLEGNEIMHTADGSLELIHTGYETTSDQTLQPVDLIITS